MPIASKISNRVLLTNDKEYTLSNIFHKYENFTPQKVSLDFAKKYISEFNNNYIKPIHLEKINLRTDNFVKNFIKDFLKLPIRILKIFLKIKINSILNYIELLII